MAPRGTRGTGHGGARQGTPGKAYSNRTDLMSNYAPTQGLQTPAIGGQNPTPPSPKGTVPGATIPGAPPQPAAPVSAAQPSPAQQGIHPDLVTPLDAPTDRPNEPVTAGIGDPSLGVGVQWATTRDVVSAAAAVPGASPALQAMAARLGLGY